MLWFYIESSGSHPLWNYPHGLPNPSLPYYYIYIYRERDKKNAAIWLNLRFAIFGVTVMIRKVFLSEFLEWRVTFIYSLANILICYYREVLAVVSSDLLQASIDPGRFMNSMVQLLGSIPGPGTTQSDSVKTKRAITEHLQGCDVLLSRFPTKNNLPLADGHPDQQTPEEGWRAQQLECEDK